MPANLNTHRHVHFCLTRHICASSVTCPRWRSWSGSSACLPDVSAELARELTQQAAITVADHTDRIGDGCLNTGGQALAGRLRGGRGRGNACSSDGSAALGQHQQADHEDNKRDKRYIKDDGVHSEMPPGRCVVAGSIWIGGLSHRRDRVPRPTINNTPTGVSYHR